jgi:hypothetical protein
VRRPVVCGLSDQLPPARGNDEERGVEVDHSTLNRLVLKYVPLPPCCMNRSLVASPLSPRVSRDPDGGRHAERRHPVEHVAANFCLGPLIGQSSGAKSPAENGHVAIHCGFDQAAAIVA